MHEIKYMYLSILYFAYWEDRYYLNPKLLYAELVQNFASQIILK